MTLKYKKVLPCSKLLFSVCHESHLSAAPSCLLIFLQARLSRRLFKKTRALIGHPHYSRNPFCYPSFLFSSKNRCCFQHFVLFFTWQLCSLSSPFTIPSQFLKSKQRFNPSAAPPNLHRRVKLFLFHASILTSRPKCLPQIKIPSLLDLHSHPKLHSYLKLSGGFNRAIQMPLPV